VADAEPLQSADHLTHTLMTLPGNSRSIYIAALLASLCLPASATVAISFVKPSVKSPQPVGSSITWTVKATDTNSGPLTFQFNVAPPGGPSALVKDFNVGTLKSGAWVSQPFAWLPVSCSGVPQPSGVVAYTCLPVEGVYQIQVMVKDFVTGESAAKTVRYQITPIVTGSAPAVVAASNPLIAFFSSPACAAGSLMRVSFQPQSGSSPAAFTNWVACHPPQTMTFEIAGMYPSTAYNIFAQTQTGATITNGPTLGYTTGALPTGVHFPPIQIITPPGPNADTTDSMLLFTASSLGGGRNYPDVATDLAGNFMWYSTTAHYVRRALLNGTMLSTQNGRSWTPGSQKEQLLQQLDLAGNVIRETNTGIVQQQLLTLGAIDGGPCDIIPRPAPIGAACLGSFHHDVIQTLPNGYTAALVDIEKIFPPGTQGDTSGLPVDIVGDMIVVLDANWQVAWYFDTFQHDDGAPQLNINRPAVKGETCMAHTAGCPPIFLLGAGIALKAHDWLHANSVYYWPLDSQTGVAGDLIWSSRHQDWVMKVDYQNGAGSGNILWRMGLDGDFSFNNIANDPWPWFSHQHEAGIEDNGAGVLTLFDNGNTRVSPPPLGLGKNCEPSDCNSRGMALTFDETAMQVTPVLSQDLGSFSIAMGSAQLLSNGDYFFLSPIVVLTPHHSVSYSVEILPSAGMVTGTPVFDLEGPESYRAWQLPNLYNPPIT
jgi:arylsulfate sulfotransferase